MKYYNHQRVSLLATSPAPLASPAASSGLEAFAPFQACHCVQQQSAAAALSPSSGRLRIEVYIYPLKSNASVECYSATLHFDKCPGIHDERREEVLLNHFLITQLHIYEL
jgi:hypothetical protein